MFKLIYCRLILTLIFLFILSCSKQDDNRNNTSQKNQTPDFVSDSASELTNYDIAIKEPSVIKLPKNLKEVSGLAFSPEGNLFAHQDEAGYVYQINLQNGEIVKIYSLGYPPVRADFEDIAYAEGKFYLLSNDGALYSFEEAADKNEVAYEKIKTNLKSSNDAEGLCYDPDTRSLLIALKGNPGEDYKKAKTVYSFSLERKELDKEPRFVLNLSQIKKTFNPSGIQRHPVSGSFFIIAANGNAIIEISKEGKLLNRQDLPTEVHKQPEGIAFGPDNSLYISNEGKGSSGYIVIYPYEK